MQCGVKRKRSQSTTEFDIEHQHTLFDLSMMKLHQEHMRNGMEPRLVRFVLINNALKLLQMHMLRLEEEDALGSMDYDGASSRFFTNTFRHGIPRPLSPLASPAKTLKLDQNPLLVATPFQNGEECEEEEGPRTPVTPPLNEERKVGLATVNSLVTVNQSSSTNGHVSRHSSTASGIEFHQSSTTTSPRRECQETSSNTTGATSTSSSASLPSPPILEHISLEPSAQLDVTPSQDFAKVDTAIYDYDVPGGSSSSSSSSSSRTCTMQAIGTPVVQNGGTSVEDRDGSESPPDPTTESDFLDELDHIVNLLMT